MMGKFPLSQDDKLTFPTISFQGIQYLSFKEGFLFAQLSSLFGFEPATVCVF